MSWLTKMRTHTHSHWHKHTHIVFTVLCWCCLVHSLRSSLGDLSFLSLPHSLLSPFWVQLLYGWSYFPKWPPPTPHPLMARHSLLIYDSFTIWKEKPVYKNPSFSALQPVFIKMFTVYFSLLLGKSFFFFSAAFSPLDSSQAKTTKETAFGPRVFSQS